MNSIGAKTVHATDVEPGSTEAIVEEFLDTALGGHSALVEFLERVSQDRPSNPHYVALANYLAQRQDWAVALQSARDRINNEKAAQRYLLVEIEDGRVKGGWLWTAREPEALTLDGSNSDLGVGLRMLLSKAQRKIADGVIHVELLAPDELLLLPKKALAAFNRFGGTIDPEREHPVALRWRDRMRCERDPDYRASEWRFLEHAIRENLNQSCACCCWVKTDVDPIAHRSAIGAGSQAPITGIELPLSGEALGLLLRIVCLASLPYAYWPRRGGAKPHAAVNHVEKLVGQHGFEEIRGAVQRDLAQNEDHALSDLLFFWDDPNRNPYRKHQDTTQKG